MIISFSWIQYSLPMYVISDDDTFGNVCRVENE